MTRGPKMNKDDSKNGKNVLRLTCLKALVSQLYMTTWSLVTCTIHSALVAMSPSGGNRWPLAVCTSLAPSTCVNKVTPEVEGGGAALGLVRPGAWRSAAAFFAAT